MRGFIGVVAALLLSSSAWAAGAAPPAQDQAACPCMGNGMRGRGGMMGCGPGGCGQMMGNAEVTVENTADGAIVRMKARDASQVAAVQRHAHMMEQCMGSTTAPVPSK